MSKSEEIIQQWNFSKSMIQRILNIPSIETASSLKSILQKFQSSLETIETSSEQIDQIKVSNDNIFQNNWQYFLREPKEQDVQLKKNKRNHHKTTEYFEGIIKKSRKIEQQNQITCDNEFSASELGQNNQRNQKVLINEENQEILLNDQHSDQEQDLSNTEFCEEIEQEEEQEIKEKAPQKKSKKPSTPKVRIMDAFPSTSNEMSIKLIVKGFYVQKDKYITNSNHLSWKQKDKSVNKKIWATQKNSGYKKQLNGAHQYVKNFFETKGKNLNELPQDSTLNEEQNNYLKSYCEAFLLFLKFRKMNLLQCSNYLEKPYGKVRNEKEMIIIFWKFSSKKSHLIINQEDNGEMEEKILHLEKKYNGERKLTYIILPLLTLPLCFVEYSGEQILKASQDKYMTKKYQNDMKWRAAYSKCKLFSDFYQMNVKNIGTFQIKSIIDDCKANPQGNLANHFNKLENASLYKNSETETALLFYCVFNAIQPPKV